MATTVSKTVSKTRKKLVPRLALSAEKGNEILGWVLLAVVLLLAGSLLTYHPDDPSLLSRDSATSGARNMIGPVGANLAALFFALVGLGALLVPVLLGVIAYRHLRHRAGDKPIERAVGVAIVLLALPGFLDLLLGEIVWRGAPMRAGGTLGYLLADTLAGRLNFGGAFVVLLALLLIGGTLAGQSTLTAAFAASRERLTQWWARLALRRAQRREHRAKAETKARVMSRHLARTGTPRAAEGESDRQASRAPAVELPPLRVRARRGEPPYAVRKVTLPAAANAGPGSSAPAPSRSPSPSSSPGPSPSAPPIATRSRPGAGTAPPAARAAKTQTQASLGFSPDELKPGELPPVNLLELTPADERQDEAELVRQGDVIQNACREFGVEGTIEGIGPGPVITVFELQPAPGVKVSRIVNLQDDLALALKAESVRIDRIPGRSTLGIEVPNKKRGIIRLGSLLAQEPFARARSPLTLAIGVDIHGRPHYADLATMPHLLVAGATGAGKSVGLQSMITSILYKATKDEVKFIFIDPKRIELGVYADIPHLKTEVVIEPKKAANALRWAVGEMERRYRLLAELHVRSIAFYNQAIRDPETRARLSLVEGEAEITDEDLKPLPYYVIIIDELADLMMVASSDVETSIARLAQMARAVGIHLIVATQRPSVDVLTGTIKANFPCRLSYATATRHDSRTILDQVGSEKLLGKGDALFMPAGTSRIVRLHGAYISEQETASLIRWLKKRGKPDLDPRVVEAADDGKGGGAGGGGSDEADPLFDEAARLVVRERMASASFLQRRMRVGFSRAARLIDMMEQDGLLGPPQGSKPREVLVPAEFFEEVDGAA